jgi:hypothetical protein
METSAVDPPAVPNPDDLDRHAAVVDPVDDAVVPDTDAIRRTLTLKGNAARWSRGADEPFGCDNPT